MDKSCQSSAGSTTTSTNDNTNESCSNINTSGGNTRDQYLKHLNKLSHKISKPSNKKPTFDTCQSQQQNQSHQSDQPPFSQAQAQEQEQQNLQHQPPVYNINKNDFRDVVQKLTGSPAHERVSNPQPIQQPKPQSSRLQRIRPPPLAQISNRPHPMLHPNTVPLALVNANNPVANHSMNVDQFNNFAGFDRPTGHLSPLPPFPTVHAAAESPVSAYMRFLRNSMPNFDRNAKQFSGFSPLAPLVSPRWNNLIQTQSQQEPPLPIVHHLPAVQRGIINSSTTSSSVIQPQSQFQTPASPLPFGCLNSPRSPYPLLSPGLLFSPNSGQLGFPQLPLSPTVPVPSPRWRDL